MTKIASILLILGSLTLGFSEETTAQQIEVIQNAPEEQRAELMNELKQNIASMNEEDRISAINEIHTKMQENHNSSSQLHIGGEHNNHGDIESHINNHNNAEMHNGSHSDSSTHQEMNKNQEETHQNNNFEMSADKETHSENSTH